MKKYFKFLFFFLLITSTPLIAQDTDDGDDTTKTSSKGFHIGLYVGALFANNYTASVYDGYGIDVDGNKNNFDNSLMNNKINLEYGARNGSGQIDYIAQALKVQDNTQWAFGPSDMPVNMRYNVAFLLGLQMRYSADDNNAILLNINASQLNITGNFTIYAQPPSYSTQINQAIQTFAITGMEQRLMFQLGYHHIFGEVQKMNVFAEAGLNVTYAQMKKNEILINDLHIDLLANYYLPGGNAYVTKRPSGIGYGAFAGLGVNVNMNSKFRIQLVYNPTYEGIKLQKSIPLKFQHAIGLRMYYNF